MDIENLSKNFLCGKISRDDFISNVNEKDLTLFSYYDTEKRRYTIHEVLVETVSTWFCDHKHQVENHFPGVVFINNFRG